MRHEEDVLETMEKTKRLRETGEEEEGGRGRKRKKDEEEDS